MPNSRDSRGCRGRPWWFGCDRQGAVDLNVCTKISVTEDGVLLFRGPVIYFSIDIGKQREVERRVDRQQAKGVFLV